jgi:predicted Zn-dependent peptidase
MTVAHRQFTLPNGLRIEAEVDPSAATASVGYFFRTGARDERPELMGVSHFLEHMMFKGSAKRGAEKVNQDFDSIGANHNAFTSTELTAYYAHVLPEHVPAATEILSDILRPALRDADFTEEKGVILEEIAMYEDQPPWVLYERMMELLYGSHPLAHRVLGTKDTIRDLDRNSMRRYFDDRYSADSCTVAAAGRIDFDGLVRDVRNLCGSWKATGQSRDYPTWTPLARDETIRLKNATRHYLMLAAPAPGINDPWRYRAALLADILGDGDGSRLHWALTETGLAEDAGSSYDGHDGTGEFLVTAACDPKDAAEVERIARREIDGLVESLNEDDLVRSRSKIATSFTLSSERPHGRMLRLGMLSTYRAPYLTLDEELARVERITLDDLRTYAERWPIAPCVAARLVPAE